MKTRCPCCGAENSLDALVNHDAARQAVWALAQMGDELTRLAVMYVGLFRPVKTALSFDRMAKLLQELNVQIDEGFIERNGQRHDAPKEFWIHGLRAVLERREALSLPLKSHGYLYEIMSTSAQIKSVPTPTSIAMQSNKPTSQTMSGLAVLESMKGNGHVHQR
ncbi:hypothetical protein [Vitreoscilla stercoraria]|uniref:Replication protein n=1 Tax=Vitreoscilla stercoraria TaxID=61 RepID=A0ABY4EFV5_VITST|nr:hypothetical protein [Vitreoscilla stercoraria]UOO93603.1 hypothetical protein LVJ81_06150 [Vitreoscilla stercoraria]